MPTIDDDLSALIDARLAAVLPAFQAALAPIAADTALLVQHLGATQSAATVSAPASATAPAAPNYWPTDEGDAPTSPDGSEMLRDGTTITGRPYLKDSLGSIHVLVPVTAAVPSGYTINGIAVTTYAGVTATELNVRGGRVYVEVSGGQWQLANPDMGNGLYNTGLPPLGTGAVASAVTTPAAPPAPYAVAPGSSNRILTPAPGHIAAALALAQDGDTLALDGHYAEPFPVIPVSLKITLTAATVLDFTDQTPQTLAEGKGGLVPLRDLWVTGPGVIMGAGIKEASAGGTAGVRPGATCIITLDGGLILRGNQNGLAGGGFPWVANVGQVTFDHNGLGDGQGTTHDIYVSDGGAYLNVNGMTATNPNGGHAVKSRALVTSISNATLAATDATVVDISDGGTCTIADSTLTKPAGSANHGVIGYAMENTLNGTPGMAITGGTIDCECDSPLIQGAAGTTITLAGVTFKGTKPTAAGATVVGL